MCGAFTYSVDPSLFCYSLHAKEEKSKEITLDNQTECSSWRINRMMYSSGPEWGLRVTLDVKWVTLRQSTTVSKVTTPNPEIQRNQYWQWDAVWRVVYQYQRADGGRFINQSCLSGSDCTRALTIAGQEGMSAVYCSPFKPKQTLEAKMLIKSYIISFRSILNRSHHFPLLHIRYFSNKPNSAEWRKYSVPLRVFDVTWQTNGWFWAEKWQWWNTPWY